MVRSSRIEAVHRKGFTLVELLVVVAIMALLLAIVAPRYFDSLDRAKEAALKTNLRVMREALDKYKADTGQWPVALHMLVEARYLQSVPADPMTEQADTWILTGGESSGTMGVSDVHSGAPGTGRNGVPYRQW